MNEPKTSSGEAAGAEQRMSDYAMVLDLLGELPAYETESEVIEKVFDLFSMLCKPSTMIYLPLEASKPGQIMADRRSPARINPWSSGCPPLPGTMPLQLQGKDSSCAFH